MATADEKKHELQRVGARIAEDISTGAKAAAEKMLGEHGGPGGVTQTRDDFLDYVRRNATQPEPAGGQWRLAFLEQMIVAIENPYKQAEDGADAYIPARNGVVHCENILKDAFPLGWPASPPPPPEPLPEPMPAAPSAPMPVPPAPEMAPPPDYAAKLAQIPPEVLLNYLSQMQQGAPPQPGVPA